jgi:PAS domain-containing protein
MPTIHLVAMEIFGYTITAFEIIAGGFSLLVLLAAAIKAIKDIRVDGWQPFKEKWITPRASRRQKLDGLISKFDEFGEKINRIDAELRTNGGSSVKDMVCRIDRKVEHIQARVRHQDETNTKPIFELDAAGHLTFANCAFREILDAEETDLTHRSYVARIHADDRTRFLRELNEAIENKMPIDSTIKFRYDNSGFIAIRIQANPDVRPGGELQGFFGTAMKIGQ